MHVAITDQQSLSIWWQKMSHFVTLVYTHTITKLVNMSIYGLDVQLVDRWVVESDFTNGTISTLHLLKMRRIAIHWVASTSSPQLIMWMRVSH